jgi:hypothetical protein
MRRCIKFKLRLRPKLYQLEIAFDTDQGYTGEEPAQAALAEGIELQVIKLPEAKKGFVLLPRCWAVERSFGWLNRFRRLARDYERLPETLAGLHFVVFSVLMLVHFAALNKSDLARRDPLRSGRYAGN